jgi:TRAP-type mannitol/chloroaromatic compound transport system permease large subunit
VLDWLGDNLALIMFVAMFFSIFCGYPVAFVMGGMALLFALAGSALDVFPMVGLSNIVLRMWGGVAADPVLASIPMFIFMGAILERSGSAMDMLKATEVLLKRIPGALAVAVMTFTQRVTRVSFVGRAKVRWQRALAIDQPAETGNRQIAREFLQELECAPGAGQDQAAGLTVCRG